MLFAASFNAQNWPEGMRDLWVSDSPGFCILTADYNQIEARWTAFYARDEKMTRAFLDGKDLHAMMAAAVFGCEPTKKSAASLAVNVVTGEKRPFASVEECEAFCEIANSGFRPARWICKRIRHGRNFGMEAKKMSLVTGLPEDVCRRLIDEDRKMWPTTTRWQEAVVEEALRNRRLTTVFARTRRFATPPPTDWQTRSVFAWADAREAMSFKPQSSAASMLKRVSGEMYAEAERLWPEKLPHLFWASTHDAISLYVPLSEVKVWALWMKQHMERPFPEAVWEPFYPQGFYCPVDFKHGKTWAGELGKVAV